MSVDHRLRLLGGTGSPYTRKMVSLLRFRHIPYSMIWRDPNTELDVMGLEKPRPTFLPTFLFENEDGQIEPVCDSTPIIRRLETLFPGRSVLPADPALAFIDYLLEDFGDEWCTKYMFHYRWYPQADATNAARLLPLSFDVSLPEEERKLVQQEFGARQIGRLHVVGSNDQTAGLIDASYRRFLAAMDAHLANQNFLLGNRPGAGDFAIFGQLTQLIGFDPTPRAIAIEIAPRTVAWVDQVEDLSGLSVADNQWMSLDIPPASLRSLLMEVGRVYAPAQLANAAAVMSGDANWETEIDGATWTQRSFPYQAKCLQWTRDRYAALSPNDRRRVDSIIDGTGCETMLTDIG